MPASARLLASSLFMGNYSGHRTGFFYFYHTAAARRALRSYVMYQPYPDLQEGRLHVSQNGDDCINHFRTFVKKGECGRYQVPRQRFPRTSAADLLRSGNLSVHRLHQK